MAEVLRIPHQQQTRVVGETTGWTRSQAEKGKQVWGTSRGRARRTGFSKNQGRVGQGPGGGAGLGSGRASPLGTICYGAQSPFC